MISKTEYLYKFISKETNNWKYIDLNNLDIPIYKMRAIPMTLSQYINIKDRHNNYIYTNDIVKFTTYGGDEYIYFIWYNRENPEITVLRVDDTLVFNGIDFTNRCKPMGTGDLADMISDHYGTFEDVKVIGNFYDGILKCNFYDGVLYHNDNATIAERLELLAFMNKGVNI